jgi:peptidoglycan/xylan/chitin deacetylase (PgdA/CDA1 family)
MWVEVPLKQEGRWPKGVRLPVIISVHHQSEEAAVVFGDGQVDPFDYSERQYGGRRGAWRLLEIMGKHNVLGTWIICGATVEKYPAISKAVKAAGHAIAGHTYEHEMMCNYPPEQELRLVRKTVEVF